jgi:hypothetical protein
MNLDTLVVNVCHGHINLPSALVLCTLIIVAGAVLITWIKGMYDD